MQITSPVSRSAAAGWCWPAGWSSSLPCRACWPASAARTTRTTSSCRTPRPQTVAQPADQLGPGQRRTAPAAPWCCTPGPAPSPTSPAPVQPALQQAVHQPTSASPRSVRPTARSPAASRPPVPAARGALAAAAALVSSDQTIALVDLNWTAAQPTRRPDHRRARRAQGAESAARCRSEFTGQCLRRSWPRPAAACRPS